MVFKNKYGMELSQEIFELYYDNLIGGFYKILPLFEGLDVKSKEVIHDKDKAYDQFQKYITNFIVEICGGYYMFENNVKFLKLVNILEGMQHIEYDEHKKLKSSVFNCISICNKLKEGVK